MSLLTSLTRLRVRRSFVRFPGRGLVLGVLLLIGIGTAGLLLPGARQGDLALVDALLLATSAVCTTGLSSVNVAQVLSPAGQLWLISLVEVGALALLVLAFGFIGLGRRRQAATRAGISDDLGLLITT